MSGIMVQAMRRSDYTVEARAELVEELPDEVLDRLGSGFIENLIYEKLCAAADPESDCLLLSDRLKREQRSAARRFNRLLKPAIARIAKEVFGA